jgi:serine/threonine protein phosphatase 1
MKAEKHYIIGDIHGEYQTLLALVDRLPKDAKLIFVGDYISRGKQSKEVIEFVKKHAFCAIRGNHEEYLLKFGSLFLEIVENPIENSSPVWVCHMINSTLRSYGLLDKDSCQIIKNEKGIKELKEAMRWIETLPVYYEFGYTKGYTLPVVVSHAIVEKYWFIKDIDPNYFAFHALNNRQLPSNISPIFNIFGHISKDEVILGDNFVALDTGCGKGADRKLSAYCVETKEVISVSIVSN